MSNNNKHKLVSWTQYFPTIVLFSRVPNVRSHASKISFGETSRILYLNNVRGTLQTNQAIKGLQTGSVRVVNSITNPTLDLYSGKILYISDKLPITRDPAQTERIRFILSF